MLPVVAWKQSLLKAVSTFRMLLKLSWEQRKYFNGPCSRSLCNLLKCNTYYCFPPKPRKDCWTLMQSLISCPSPQIYSMNWDTPKRPKYFPGRESCPQRTNTVWQTSFYFQCLLSTWVSQDITHESYSIHAFLIYGKTIHTDKWTAAYLMF